MGKIPAQVLGIPEDKLLMIGIAGDHEQLSLDRDSAKVLPDYRVVILDPQNMRMKNPAHLFSKRYSELRTFIKKGGVFICFLRTPRGVLNVAGTPTNTPIYSFIALEWGERCVSLHHNIGDVTLTKAGEKSCFADALRKIKQFDIYAEVYGLDWGKFLVNVLCLAESSDEKCVAFEVSQEGSDGGGKMVFLPAATLEYFPTLLDCIAKELSRLGNVEFPPAAWTRYYAFPEYEDDLKNIQSKEGRLERLKQQLKAEKARLKELERIRDVLLNGKGEILRKTVKSVFNELGMAFEDGPEGRDDLLLKDANGKTILVCEVKGSSKSAKEKDAAQLEKWRARVFEEEGHEPEGLLIVNTWCEFDPTERKEQGEDFPDQMLNYSKGKGFCLMTTIQLFNMWCDFKRKKLKGGKELLNKIMKTPGVFEGYDDISVNRLPEQAD